MKLGQFGSAYSSVIILIRKDTEARAFTTTMVVESLSTLMNTVIFKARSVLNIF